MMVLAAALAAVLGGSSQPAQDTTPDLAVVARRFYQPAANATTVEVLAELQLDAVPAASQVVRYRMAVTVRDSAGIALTETAWNREIPAAVARRPGASATESFRFSASPGRYTVAMRVTAEGIDPIVREVMVQAYGARPPSSDLVLATAARAVDDSAAVEPGEIRRAGVAMRSAPRPRMSLDSTRILYYMEVYPSQPDGLRGDLVVEVLGSDGRRVVQTPARPVTVEAAGGVTRGAMDLAGLPEGRYTLRVAIRSSGSAISAEAPFEVQGRNVAARPVAPPADVFETMTERGLDSLYGPTEYLLESRERGTYSSLSLAGKRRFMQTVWRRRDPTPNTPDNPALGEFLRQLQFVNSSFRESGTAGRTGWSTDRGRVYLRNGAPDEVMRRPSASPRPYEVWKFTRGRTRFYVFYDRSGLGNYELIGSNDVSEASQSGWESYLGPEGSQDVRDFIR